MNDDLRCRRVNVFCEAVDGPRVAKAVGNWNATQRQQKSGTGFGTSTSYPDLHHIQGRQSLDAAKRSASAASRSLAPVPKTWPLVRAPGNWRYKPSPPPPA